MAIDIKPLYHQLAKPLRKASPKQRDDARDALLKSLACGYIGFVAIEPRLSLHAGDVGLDRAWSITVSCFRGEGVRRLGLPTAFVKLIETQGEQTLVCLLRIAGVLGRREGRVGQLGRYHAHAGRLMRACQAGFEFDLGVEFIAQMGAARWPLAEMQSASQ